MAEKKFAALMGTGISQVRISMKDACADAIRDISLGYHKTYGIYEIDGWTMRYLGYVCLVKGSFKFIVNGKTKALNKNGSFRKTPEPRPFLR